jgi:hypothetical protein
MINDDTPVNEGFISGYINCIPYGASVTVCFKLSLSNLVADKLDLEAFRNVGDNGYGATPCTVAVLPSHRARDIFVRACNAALTHCIVRAVFDQINVEATTSEVEEDFIAETERSPRIPRYVVCIDLRSQGDQMGKQYAECVV